MGYSNTQLAGITLELISDRCFDETGSQNIFVTPQGKFFYEVGRENRDGAITGSIYRFLPDDKFKATSEFRIEPDGYASRRVPKHQKTIEFRIEPDGYVSRVPKCCKTDTFRIEPDGFVSRGPKWMKVTHLRLEIDGVVHGPWFPKYGLPSEAALFTKVKEYADSFKVGGVNAHISKSKGHIPYPNSARIVTLAGVMVEWKAAMFQVWE